MLFASLFHFQGEPGFSSTPIPKSPGCERSEFVSPFHETRVTTVMTLGEELWVGLGNGQVLIFDVMPSDHDDEEAYVMLTGEEAETSQKRSVRRMGDQLPEEDSAMVTNHEECEVKRVHDKERPHAEEGSKVEVRETNGQDLEHRDAMKLTSEEHSRDVNVAKAPETGLTGKTRGKRERRRESERADKAGEDKHREARGRRQESVGSFDDFREEYKVRLKMRVHFRISEEAIRCLLLLR